jgi:hypothetical protein
MITIKQVAQITEGWYNDFLKSVNALDPHLKEIGEVRMKICSDCPVRTENRCDRGKSHIGINGKEFKGCGCRIDKKTLCKDCACPGGFW